MYYWAKNYADLKRGEEYDQLKRTVAIVKRWRQRTCSPRTKWPKSGVCGGQLVIAVKLRETGAFLWGRKLYRDKLVLSGRTYAKSCRIYPKEQGHKQKQIRYLR